MMTCSKNLFKHLRHVTKSKTNREMLEHDFHFFVNLITFSLKNSDQIYPFHVYFSHLCKISNQKKKCECFHSHSHILKELHEFLFMMGAITIFGKNSFIFNFETYELMTNSLRGCVHIWGGGKENKCQNMNVNFFQPN